MISSCWTEEHQSLTKSISVGDVIIVRFLSEIVLGNVGTSDSPPVMRWREGGKLWLPSVSRLCCHCTGHYVTSLSHRGDGPLLCKRGDWWECWLQWWHVTPPTAWHRLSCPARPPDCWATLHTIMSPHNGNGSRVSGNGMSSRHALSKYWVINIKWTPKILRRQNIRIKVEPYSFHKDQVNPKSEPDMLLLFCCCWCSQMSAVLLWLGGCGQSHSPTAGMGTWAPHSSNWSHINSRHSTNNRNLYKMTQSWDVVGHDIF